jgi:hypothetical protein
VQRDDQTLTLRLDNREIVVGKHRWWYSPYWQAADNVRIACDRDQRIRRVVFENCRLIVSSSPQGKAGRIEIFEVLITAFMSTDSQASNNKSQP